MSTFFFPLLLSFPSHPSLDDSDALCPDVDDKQDGEKAEKHKNKKDGVKKVPKPELNKGRGHSKVKSSISSDIASILP